MRRTLICFTLLALAGAARAAERPPPRPTEAELKSLFAAAVTAADPKVGPPLAEPVFASSADRRNYWPDLASRSGAGGYAVIQCASEPDGRLHDCKSLAVVPLGWGFDDAAMRMADDRKLTIIPDNARASGSLVRLVIEYKQPFRR